MVPLTEVKINENGLSSRENKILEVFEVLDSKTVSTETLRQLTGYGHKVLHKTIGKLMHKGYLEKATTCKVQFYRSNEDKLKKALDKLKEEGMVAETSEAL